MSPAAVDDPERAPRARGFWVRQLTAWHWMSAAISLLGMLSFAVTGITLNHARDIPAKPVRHHIEAVLPAEMKSAIARGPADGSAPLPASVATWLERHVQAQLAERDGEWSADEVYLTLSRPGADGSISVDRRTGAVTVEENWRGWIAFLNDLHKGRNAGPYWNWFIDIFAAACVIFCLTGLGILWLKSAARRMTWPLVGAGVLMPLLLILFLLH